MCTSFFSLTLVTLFVRIRHSSSDNTIDCVHDDCTCTINSECTIKCDGEDVCNSHTLTCRSGQRCIIKCIGEDSCNDAILDGSRATNLEIICDEENSCKDTKIYCGSDDCSLECYGEDSCDSTVVIIDADTKSFQCGGTDCPSTISTQAYSPDPTNSPLTPTKYPTVTSTAPTTLTPTDVPTDLSTSPTNTPTVSPIGIPSKSPLHSLQARSPSQAPTQRPIKSPTLRPIKSPTLNPSIAQWSVLKTTATEGNINNNVIRSWLNLYGQNLIFAIIALLFMCFCICLIVVMIKRRRDNSVFKKSTEELVFNVGLSEFNANGIGMHKIVSDPDTPTSDEGVFDDEKESNATRYQYTNIAHDVTITKKSGAVIGHSLTVDSTDIKHRLQDISVRAQERIHNEASLVMYDEEVIGDDELFDDNTKGGLKIRKVGERYSNIDDLPIDDEGMDNVESSEEYGCLITLK